MSIHLNQLVLREIHLPLVEPFRISSGVEELRRILLLELTDVDGLTVFAESVAGIEPNYAPETIDTVWLVLSRYIAPRVLNRRFENPSAVHEALQVNFRGHNMAKATLEMGCWALTAEKRGISLSELLGGTRERIATGISIGIQDSPAALVARAQAAFAEGYPKIKIKIKPGADLAYLAAVREALGPDAALMGDANNAYTPADFEHLRKMDAFNLLMLEQPLAWDDVYQHAALQRELRTPICLDESILNRDRAREMIELKAGKIVNIKPGRVGGFTESLAIHDMAVASGLPVWCGGMLESGIGRAYNVALASLPGFTMPGDLSPSKRYWHQDIVTPEWTMDAHGMVTVPRHLPGLGVTVDLDRIENLTVRTETLR